VVEPALPAPIPPPPVLHRQNAVAGVPLRRALFGAPSPLLSPEVMHLLAEAKEVHDDIERRGIVDEGDSADSDAHDTPPPLPFELPDLVAPASLGIRMTPRVMSQMAMAVADMPTEEESSDEY
jgi:hypothetical protein